MNLTKDSRIAWEVADWNQVPDHDRVVFRRVGAGMRFRAHLRPGEKLKRSLLELSASFVTFAVSHDADLKHAFSRKYLSQDQLHSFVLNFVIEYWIADPVRLVESLESDPLHRLEKEVQGIIDAAVRRIEWRLIEQESPELEHLLLVEVPAAQDVLTNGERLRRFAADLGFQLLRIGITRSLVESDKVYLRISRDEERLALTHTHGTEIVEEELLKQEKALLVQHGTDAIRRLERTRKVLDAMIEEGSRGLRQAVDDVRSFTALHEALREVDTLVRMIGSLEAEVSTSKTGTHVFAVTPAERLGNGSQSEEFGESAAGEFAEEVERVKALTTGLAKRLQGCEKTIDASLGRIDRTLEALVSQRDQIQLLERELGIER